jgi:hypothetical protein
MGNGTFELKYGTAESRKVSSGKKLSEPVLTPSQEMEPLPITWQKYLEYAGQLMSHIKTYDQPTYEIKVEGTTVKVKM